MAPASYTYNLQMIMTVTPLSKSQTWRDPHPGPIELLKAIGTHDASVVGFVGIVISLISGCICTGSIIRGLVAFVDIFLNSSWAVWSGSLITISVTLRRLFHGAGKREVGSKS